MGFLRTGSPGIAQREHPAVRSLGPPPRATGRSWKGEDGMSVKRVCLGSLVVTVLGLGLARGQGPASPYGGPGPATPGLPGVSLPPLGTPSGLPAAGGMPTGPEGPARPTPPGTYYGGPGSLETP